MQPEWTSAVRRTDKRQEHRRLRSSSTTTTTTTTTTCKTFTARVERTHLGVEQVDQQLLHVHRARRLHKTHTPSPARIDSGPTPTHRKPVDRLERREVAQMSTSAFAFSPSRTCRSGRRPAAVSRSGRRAHRSLQGNGGSCQATNWQFLFSFNEMAGVAPVGTEAVQLQGRHERQWEWS